MWSANPKKTTHCIYTCMAAPHHSTHPAASHSSNGTDQCGHHLETPSQETCQHPSLYLTRKKSTLKSKAHQHPAGSLSVDHCTTLLVGQRAAVSKPSMRQRRPMGLLPWNLLPRHPQLERYQLWSIMYTY